MKKNALYLCLALLVIPSIACARNFQPYIGLEVGSVSADTGVSNLTGSATLDKDDTGLKLIGGFRFNDFVSIEANYSDLGEASLKGNAGDTFQAESTTWVFLVNNANLKTETTSFGLSGVFSLPIGKISNNDRLNFISPFISVGVHSWDMDATISGTGLAQSTLSDDGTDFSVGTGVNFDITDHFAARVEYNYYGIDDDNGFIDSISTFYAGGIVKF